MRCFKSPPYWLRGGKSTWPALPEADLRPAAGPEQSRRGTLSPDPSSPLTPLPGRARGTGAWGILDPPSPLTPLPGGARGTWFPGAGGTWRGEPRAEARVCSVPLAAPGRGVRGEGASPARRRIQAKCSSAFGRTFHHPRITALRTVNDVGARSDHRAGSGCRPSLLGAGSAAPGASARRGQGWLASAARSPASGL